VVGGGVDAELAERLGVLLGALAGGGVDQARLGLAHGPQHHRLAALLVLAERLHLERQVGPVEAAHDDLRLLEPQPPHDLVADRR
jgi:hypothetical protein